MKFGCSGMLICTICYLLLTTPLISGCFFHYDVDAQHPEANLACVGVNITLIRADVYDSAPVSSCIKGTAPLSVLENTGLSTSSLAAQIIHALTFLAMTG